MSWPDAQLWVERFFVAVAHRHASGRGGPLSTDVVQVDEETIVLPVQGAPNSDLVTTRAAARVVWEWLGDGVWSGAGDVVRFRSKERWPDLTPEHIAVLDRASADDAPSPAAISRLWSDVRERSGVTLRPMRLQKNRNVDGLTTGHFDNALGPAKPQGLAPSVSGGGDIARGGQAPSARAGGGEPGAGNGEPGADEPVFAPDRRGLVGGVVVVLLIAAVCGVILLGGVWTTTAGS